MKLKVFTWGGGFSTLEVLIALAIVIIAVSIVIELVFGSQRMALDAEMSQLALYKAQGLVERARAESRDSWSAVVSTSEYENPFTKNLQVVDIDDYVKEVRGLVGWQSGNIPRSGQISALLTAWQKIALEGRCASLAVGDWAHPQVAHAVSIGSAGSEVNGVDVKSGVAYVAVDGDGALPDLYIVDTNQNPPSVVWALNTGPGLVAVRVAGNYAYLGNTSSSAQLQIIDRTTLALTNFKLPGSTSGSGDPVSLFYYDGRVYLGTAQSDIAEFHIIEVSDLSNVHETGFWEFGLKVNAIYVSNGYAFVASPDNNEELKMLDVHDPAHITPEPGFDAPGSSGNGKSLARKGQRLYLGRTAGNIELYVLDINNAHGEPHASHDIDSSILGMATIGEFVFLATNDSTKAFQVWKLSDDGTTLSLEATLDLGARATSIDCEGQTLYVTTDDNSRGLISITPSP